MEPEDAAARSLITEAGAEQRSIPNRAQQLEDIVKRLRDQFIDRQLGALARRINQPEVPHPERIESLKQQQALRELKRQPLTEIQKTKSQAGAIGAPTSTPIRYT